MISEGQSINQLNMLGGGLGGGGQEEGSIFSVHALAGEKFSIYSPKDAALLVIRLTCLNVLS